MLLCSQAMIDGSPNLALEWHSNGSKAGPRCGPADAVNPASAVALAALEQSERAAAAAKARVMSSSFAGSALQANLDMEPAGYGAVSDSTILQVLTETSR